MTTPRDRRAQRHADTRAEVLEQVWRLAAEQGLGGWSLRDVAEAVGMRAPSLYGYFDSKNAVYDAMFGQGYAQLLAQIDAAPRPDDPIEMVRVAAHVFFDFCVEDPARHALLFLRTLPGFAPSADSYALATAALNAMAEVLAAAGRPEPEALDLWTGLLTGLATQQVSNDPGGTRWARLVDPAVDMFLAATQPSAGAARR